MVFRNSVKNSEKYLTDNLAFSLSIIFRLLLVTLVFSEINNYQLKTTNYKLFYGISLHG